MANNNFYRAFEDKFRGSHELIKERLQVYKPFLEVLAQFDNKQAIDLGCGRGEWLDVLSDEGFDALGVDLDLGMLKACRERALRVKHQDAIEALKELEDASMAVVSGFHIVEHLPFEVLQILIQESLRVLKPGGLLFLETPNPENIKIATANFYLDPTHIRPIPSQLLSFLPEHYGFDRTKVLRLQEDKELHSLEMVTLAHVIGSASPDYAVIAQKGADIEISHLFDELFEKEYGLSLENLMTKFENRLLNIERRVGGTQGSGDQARINEAEARAKEAEQSAKDAEVRLGRANEAEEKLKSVTLKLKAEQIKAKAALERAIEAEKQTQLAWHYYNLVVASKSWKITKPLRLLSDIIHRSKSGEEKTGDKKQLLVDVSQIYFDDNQTGIQRVIHNILFELSMLPMDAYDLLPVYATKGETYRYTNKFHQHNILLSKLNEKVVTVQKGDIFLGLDLTAHLFPHIETTLEEYRQNGASINYIVYDIIPLLYPQYTTEGMDEYFRVWLDGLVKCADRLICISHSVALELQRYIEEHSPSMEHIPKITSFHLGAGIDINSGLQGLRAEETSLLQRIKKKPTFLMVGTVEPRKGYYQTLLAFEDLWAKGMDINLVIVGKKGWMVEELLLRLDNHPQCSRHLFWLQGVTDDFLSEIYTSSSCLIAASKTEGFGLPLVEAARYNLPIIARNIPVFKEIAQEYAFYFDDNDQTDTITKTIINWLEQYKSGNCPHSEDISWLTWKESALQLMECLDSVKIDHQQ